MMTAFKDWWHRRSRRQKKWLIILAIILGLYGIYELNQLKYHPWRNSHPKYYVTIKGHVDPAIKDIVKLKWIAVYGSSDPKCDVSHYSLGSGSSTMKERKFDFTPTLNASGDYEVKIPIDYYKPGYCQWQIYEIEDASDVYQTRFDDRADIFVVFYPCGPSAVCEFSERYPKTAREKQYKNTGLANDIYQFDHAGRLKFIDVTGDGDFNNHSQFNAVPRNNNYLLIENHIFKP